MVADDRQTRWVNASFGTVCFHPYMPVIVQSLGRLDVQLVEQDEKYLGIYNKGEDPSPNLFEFDYFLTLSYLWVLGSYELVRTMSQKVREDDRGLSVEAKETIQLLKNDLERLRIPLAKMEPAKKYKHTDDHIAFPHLNLEYGFAWSINDDTVIPRRRLSDSFLRCLEIMRRENIPMYNMPQE